MHIVSCKSFYGNCFVLLASIKFLDRNSHAQNSLRKLILSIALCFSLCTGDALGNLICAILCAICFEKIAV